VLVPSAFYWHGVGPIIDGVELLWQPGESGPQALARVVGRSRADLLSALDAPRSTTDLARHLELSPGAVSQHLSALRAAGLLTAARHGRAVLYMRTPLADRLQSAASPAGGCLTFAPKPTKDLDSGVAAA
jgi:DNA-binding transcriptional ArsR family regulator